MTGAADRSSAPPTPDAARSATLAWLVAGLAPPIGFRLALLATLGAVPGWVDLRGVASDTAAGIAVALLAMALARGHRALGAAVIAVWFFVALGDAEHVLANGAHASLAHRAFLIDPTFVTGSVLHPTLPIGFIALVGAITLASSWIAGRGGRTPTSPWPIALGALSMGAGLALWSLPVSAPEWRLSGVLEANLRPMVRHRGEPTPDALPDPPAAPTRRERPDLSGTPIGGMPTRAPNVLLILLEGISGAHIEAIAEANGVAADPALPHLDRLARTHVAYTGFVAQQRQTNRGEYALLCGDWPRLRSGVPRMSEYVARGGVRCLPDALSALGYETVYLQAAPLGFMMKDQFMARIGFDVVLGNDWFEEARSRTNWGVDDPTLFDGALREVERLSSGTRPWFLTLLTVGTHHPYNVPADFDSPGATGFTRAARQADESLGGFVDQLARRGVLDDTLVLITSDESAGLAEAAPVDPVTLLLSRNWGFLIAIAPDTAPEAIDEPFLQSDVALSILDAIGAGDDVTGDFGGRSAFRRYDTPRRIAFGNTYQRRIFAVDPGGTIDVCREDFSICSRFLGVPGRPFHAGVVAERDLDAIERQTLRDWLDPASSEHPRSVTSTSVDLIGAGRLPVLTGSARNQLVYGGQGLGVPAHSLIELNVDVELQGLAGEVAVRMNLLAAGQEKPLSSDEVRLGSGERVRVRVLIRTGVALEDVESRFVVFDRAGDGLDLVFHRASIAFRPEPDGRAEGPPVRTAHEVEVTTGP